jgi:hypothetical protein
VYRAVADEGDVGGSRSADSLPALLPECGPAVSCIAKTIKASPEPPQRHGKTLQRIDFCVIKVTSAPVP